MNSSDYNPIIVDPTGRLHGVEQARPRQQRKEKKGRNRRGPIRGKDEEPTIQTDISDKDDPHSIDFMA